MAYFEGDLGSLTNNNGNDLGNGGWWIIIVLLLFGWGRNGFGGNNGTNGFDNFELGRLATANDVASGFATNGIVANQNDIKLSLQNGFSGIQQTLCNGFNGINQNINNNGYETRFAINGVSQQISDCCCQTQRSIDALNYNISQQFCNLGNTLNSNTRDIIENNNANFRLLHDENVALRFEQKNETIANLQAQVNALQLAQSQALQSNYIINSLRPTTTTS